jgi:D-amino-acid dehydrogenase
VVSFDKVVICAGLASRELAAQLGDLVNIYPVKGYLITVNLWDVKSQSGAPTVSLLDDETRLVTSHLGVDRFRVVGTAEFNGFNKDIRADRIKPLIDWVGQCFPQVSTGSVVPLAELRRMTPNLMPKIGQRSKPNVFYNTGHGHLGWTLSAITAQMVAQIIAQEN